MQHSWSGYSRRFYLGHQNDMKTLMMSFSIDYSWLNSENVIKLSALPLHFTERRLTLGIRRLHIFSDFVFVIHFSTILFIHSFILFYVHSPSHSRFCSHTLAKLPIFLFIFFFRRIYVNLFFYGVDWLRSLRHVFIYIIRVTYNIVFCTVLLCVPILEANAVAKTQNDSRKISQRGSKWA